MILQSLPGDIATRIRVQPSSPALHDFTVALFLEKVQKRGVHLMKIKLPLLVVPQRNLPFLFARELEILANGHGHAFVHRQQTKIGVQPRVEKLFLPGCPRLPFVFSIGF